MPAPKSYHLPTANSASQYAELLDRYGLPYDRKNHLNAKYEVESATFTLQGPLKVRLCLSADNDKARIRVDMWALEDRPHCYYSVKPERLDTELLERMAKVLTRQERRLFATEVSEGAREALRHKLEASQREQMAELERIELERSAAEADARERKLSARLQKLSQSLKDLGKQLQEQ
jgi:hypothetical protein